MHNQKRHPVALFFFNRKDCLQQVASRVLEADPPAIYLVADGPRPEVEGEADLCSEVRELLESLPWDCPVHKIYSETNLGCGRRISSGISEVLKQDESVIILEDDILPHQDFFPYCDELLSYYQNDESVFMISGLQYKEKIGKNNGYTFSFNSGIWGWATWRRAWRHYIFDPSRYILDEWFWKTMVPIRCNNSMEESDHFIKTLYFNHLQNNIDTWDAQWTLCQMRHKAYCISPNWNLVQNIGFGADSTHLKGPASSHWAGEYKSYPFDFPMRHPLPGILSTATSLMDASDMSGAMECAQDGVAKYPQEVRLYVVLAMAAHSLGHLSIASEACDKALQLDPENSHASRILGMISLKKDSE